MSTTDLIALAVAVVGGGGLYAAISHYLTSRMQTQRQSSKDAGELALEVADKYRDMAFHLQERVEALRRDLDEANKRFNEVERESKKLSEMAQLLRAALKEAKPDHPLVQAPL